MNIISTAAPICRYEIEERGHTMQYDSEGNLLAENCIVRNSAIMMYEPFLGDSGANTGADGENPQKM